MNPFSSVENSSGYVYYDLQITNLANTVIRDDIVQLTFDEQRSGAPIIDKADDYDLSIVRFQCDSYSIPVYVAQIQPGGTDSNTMIHRIIFNYKNGTDTRIGKSILKWVPVDKTLSVPIPPSQTNGYQVDSKYYWCYDYDHVCKLVNTALEEAMDVLKQDAVANPALYPAGFDAVQAPFISWNESSNTATLYTRADYFNTKNTPTALNPVIEIYMNETLYGMFNSFPINKKFPEGGSNNIPSYQIMIDNFNGAKTRQGLFNSETERFIVTPQAYSTISEFSPISSFVFISSTLPIISNQMSNPKLYENNNLIQLSRGSNNFANIITDLSTDEQSYRGSLLYAPSVYRWVSLTTSQPISQIDIQVFLKTKIGNLVPFTLPSGGSCSMKLCFKRKQY